MFSPITHKPLEYLDNLAYKARPVRNLKIELYECPDRQFFLVKVEFLTTLMTVQENLFKKSAMIRVNLRS